MVNGVICTVRILQLRQLLKALSGQELTLNLRKPPRTQINQNSAANPTWLLLLGQITNARCRGARGTAGRRDVHSPGGTRGGGDRRRAEEPPPRWTGEGCGGRGEHRSRPEAELPSAGEASALGGVGGRERSENAAALALGQRSGGGAAGERSERRHLGVCWGVRRGAETARERGRVRAVSERDAAMRTRGDIKRV
jgi:hypothetical protein